MLTSKNAAGYVRVSTAEQASSGAGMSAQREAIRRACEQRGWDLLPIYEDAGASAKSMRGREGLADCLEVLRTHMADVLVVAKLDRLSRSVVDFAGLVERSRREGWQIVVLDLGVDTSTPNGELVANVLASVAQWERRLIGLRTKEALAVKRAEGVRLGRPTSIPDPVVTEIRTMREMGATMQVICDHLNDAGVPTSRGGRAWYPSTVRAALLRVQEERERIAPSP